MGKKKRNNSNLYTELKLLVLCSVDIQTQKQKKDMLKLLQTNIDWEKFFQLAVKHRTYPLVSKNLKNIELENMEGLILLEELSSMNQLDSFLQMSELLRLMNNFKKLDIKAISIKGPALANYVYADMSMRVSRDIDILVSIDDLTMVDRILIGEGFVPIKASKQAFLQYKNYVLKNFHHTSYKNEIGIQLELHWCLNEGDDTLSFETLWDYRKENQIYGRTVNLLNDEENLIYLIVHGSKHAWKRLRWICDIYEITCKKEIDWNYIVRKMKKQGKLHLLHQTFLLLNKLFQYQPPVRLKASVKVRRAGRHLAAIAFQFLINTEEEPEAYGQSLFYLYKRYMFIWNKGIFKKLRFLLGHFKPTLEDLAIEKRKGKRFLFYYVSRPFQIVKRIATRRNLG
jgi:hypothetical protein